MNDCSAEHLFQFWGSDPCGFCDWRNVLVRFHRKPDFSVFNGCMFAEPRTSCVYPYHSFRYS